MDKQPYGTVLLKADRILDYLASCDKAQPLNQIAQATELTNSTALKILDTLKFMGYVQKGEETKKFSLGTSLLKYANKAMNQLSIKKMAQPHLEELQRRTAETVHLGILDKTSIVYVSKIDSSNPITLYSQIGKRIPLYCSAMGKAILADQSDVEINHYLTENLLIKKTKNTITTTAGFMEEIGRIRELGYAFDDGEHEDDVFCVGASIKRSDKNLCAISVSIPKYRLTDEVLSIIIQNVQNCKENIIADLVFQ